MKSGTVTLHRVLTAPPEKVFRAFSDPLALSHWIPPHGFLCAVHNFDFKVGGEYKMSFTNFTTQKSHSWTGKFTEITLHEHIQHKEVFDDPNLHGEMTTTVTLKKVSCGTDLSVAQEGIPPQIPVEMCYLGWQESLEKLAKLVQPDIADG